MPDATSPPQAAGAAPAATPPPEAFPDRPGPSLAGVLGGVQGLGRLELIAVLRADQLQRWQRGRRIPAEAYLREVPALRDDPELAIDLIFSEFVLRRDVLGEAPSLDEYVERFPDYATALRRQGDLEALWQEGARTQGRGRPAPPTAAAPPSAAEWTVFGAGCDAPAAAAGAPSVPGYEVLGELGRGGMGLVLKGHDLHLGRDLAVKLLREEYQGQPHLVRRFLNEARICGRLQHPGVVPVYELGELPDRRPYFTMKLVEGRTLADLLDERADPGQDLARFLTIFEQVCQALAYAHSKGVIHRDLKPQNVMVGAFGEVQVMDWGLAKVLERGGEGGAALAPSGAARVGGPADAEQHLRTQSGGVLGTLPYMPPEQARGEVERVDQRSDVFSLGAMLCEVLTGQPPYVGRDGMELLARAKACDHAAALAALAGCGADEELMRLTKACLAAEPSERPRDAGVVAREVTAYLAGVQERLRAVEVERAAAEARAAEARATVAAERRVRRRTLALAAAVLLFALLGGGGAVGWAWQRAELTRAVNRDLDEVVDSLRNWRLPQAEAAMLRAEGRVSGGGPAELLQRVRQTRDQLSLMDRLDRIRLNAAMLADWKYNRASVAGDYAQLFREQGLAREGEDVEVVATRIRSAAIREQLVAALDDWATATEDRQRWRWLLAVARQAQPGTWSDRFRDPEVWEKPAALELLAREADVAELSPQLLATLGRTLIGYKLDAVPLLARAQACHPGHFWLTFWLGNALHDTQPEEAMGYLRAALALRPETSAVHNNLGKALHDKGRLNEAIEEYNKSLAIDPEDAKAHNNLGVALMDKGQLDEAIEEFGKALALDPKYAGAHSNLGIALAAKGRLDDAITEHRMALALDPQFARAHNNLANALRGKGQLDDAIAEYRTTITLDPTFALAHCNLGEALHAKGCLDEAIAAYRQAIALDPKLALAHSNLGSALRAKGQLDEAIAECRQAIALNPKSVSAHANLGNALHTKGLLDEAIAEHREVIALDPTDARARLNLGTVLAAKGLLDEAIAAYRRAMVLDPQLAAAHSNLGAALRDKGWLDEAVAECRQAIRLNPKMPQAHGTLAQALMQQGQFAPAAEAARHWLELLPDRDPARQFVTSQLRRCETLLALDKHRYAAAARLYADAFAADAHLADDLAQQHRYNAACAAALASCGQGEDAKRLPDKVMQALRRQALGWLRADLAAWARQLDSDKPDRAAVRQTMQHWQQDADLAAVRDPEAMDRLPDDERKEWRQLWEAVTALLKKVEGKR